MNSTICDDIMWAVLTWCNIFIISQFASTPKSLNLSQFQSNLGEVDWSIGDFLRTNNPIVHNFLDEGRKFS